MRFKFISAFAIFAVLPGISGAKLPAVDLSSGSISAASAFGDGAQTMRGGVTPTKRVVSRNMKKTNVKYTAKKSDVDILSPNLPSSNLWAENAKNNDAPLRMPFADEVAVLHNDFELPDEDLNAKNIAKNSDDDFDIDAAMERMAQLDAKLAKLSELQRRANASVKTVSRRAITNDESDDVKISRAVVPMDEPDVLIRSVEQHKVPSRAATTLRTEQQDSLAGLSPTELRRAFRKTFLSENKHLSALRDASGDDMDSTIVTDMAGFTAEQNLSEMGGGIRPFEIKVGFRNSDSALSQSSSQSDFSRIQIDWRENNGW